MEHSRLGRRAFLAMGVGAAASPSLLSAAPTDMIQALQTGGHVIYFRHAATTWSGVDRIEWPRSRQRLLSERGIAQSRMIGAAFRAQGIPVGEVLASPFARCRDMAEIAFGRVEERMELLGLLSDAEGRAARVAYLRDQLTTEPEAGTNRIIVSHRSNIAEVAGVDLEEGEGVASTPSAGGFTLLGTARPEDWS
ncbi:MAG: histidine phosphatase family protein [Pseudomonadota bacterium]